MRLKYLVVLAVILAIGSCESIKVKKDSFKNSTILTMNMDHKAKSESWKKAIYCYGSSYFREIEKNGNETIKYFLKFSSSLVNKIDNDVFLKVDDEVIKFGIKDQSSSVNNSASTSKNMVTGKTEVRVSSANIVTVELIIPGKLKDKIANAKTIQYRIYAEGSPITLKVSDGQLEKIKLLLTHTGEEKK